MSFWVSKGNWFKLDPLVYYAHPYLIIGGLTSHCLLDLRFDFSFRIGAKIFFEFFFISSLYGYFKFHFLKKNISPFGIKICKFLYLREVCLCNFPHYFHKNRIQISVVEKILCVKRFVPTLNCNPKRYLFQKRCLHFKRSPMEL